MKSRIVKSIVAVALAFVVVVMCMPMSLAAQTSGKCGDNATWSYDEQTCELKIEGTGTVKRAEEWNQFDESLETPAVATIKSLVIGDGITDISALSWQGCYSLETVTIPATVTAEISRAFVNQTGVTEIVFKGTEQQWNSIVPKEPLMLLNDIKVTCTDGAIEVTTEVVEAQSDVDESIIIETEVTEETKGLDTKMIIIIVAAVILIAVVAVVIVKKKK